MAIVYADTHGAILRVERINGELGGRPVNATAFLDFDPATNPTLAHDIATHLALYTLISGVLSKSGTPVTITASGQDYTDGQQFAAILAALAAGTATNAQVQLVCRWMLRHGRAAGIW